MKNKPLFYAVISMIISVILVSIVVFFAIGRNNTPQMGPLEGVYSSVSKKLHDPSSAEFRNVVTIHDTYCGEVNSKDENGNYTGFREFMVRKSESRKFGLVVSFLSEHIDIFCR